MNEEPRGKITAIAYCREKDIPFFGICLGMQLAIIEFARNVAGLDKATSEEFSSDGDLVIHYMKGQTEKKAKGGSMRLGAYDCKLEKGSFIHKIYNKELISERHRHRLEVNNLFVKKLTAKGLNISGMNEELNLVETIELNDHPYFIGCQYHPEFKSKPFSPHPLFKTFIAEALKYERKI